MKDSFLQVSLYDRVGKLELQSFILSPVILFKCRKRNGQRDIRFPRLLMFSSWEQEGISLYVAVALMTRFTGMIAEVQQAASSTWSVLF